MIHHTSLNDAAELNPSFAFGKMKIWYCLPQYTRMYCMGLMSGGGSPDIKNLEKTHALLGEVSFTDPEEAFEALQGENWSPNGEARFLLTLKNLSHTSMSVGDIIEIDGKVLFVDNYGFIELK